MTFAEIRNQARIEWEALEHNDKPHILVGTATCGLASGALTVLKTIKSELAKHNIEAIITHVGCIGFCYAEPLVDIVKPNRPRICYSNVTLESIPQLIEDYIINDNPRPDLALGTIGDGSIDGIPKLFDLPMLKPQVRIVLRNCGIIDPENINHYIARDGYSGLVRALEMKPEEVIKEIKESGLRGRGGAGFPTGLKWEFCRKTPGKVKYLICNADEGDPGAFMNRSLLEGDPHAVLEGMLIGAYAIGATEGYIYIRAEYPLAIERLELALRQITEYGLIGDNILGSNFRFHITIKQGAGAFVCGEETALIASIEGKRGMPRSRPPFPVQSGLWGKPTNINNVGTWGHVSAILQRNSNWYANYGSEKSKGTKVFALAGKVNRTGLIEVPMGISLQEIIYGIGGGTPNNKRFKAVQTGGPSGGFLPTSLLNLPVGYEELIAAGSIMGSGGMIVLDEDNCIVDTARFFLSFTQAESCGKCVPCRLGTKQMLDTLEDITNGKGKLEDIDLLEDLAKDVVTGSLCGLGRTAPNPVLTSIRYFRDEYEAHIRDKRCPALACLKLISYYILLDKCEGCGICLRKCPADAITGGKRLVHVIDQDKCTKCGTCLNVCPTRFSAVTKVSGEKVAVPSGSISVTAPERNTGASDKSSKQ